MRTGIVDRAGHEVFPGAALPEEEHGRARDGRHAVHERADRLDVRMPAEDRCDRVLLPPGLLERSAFLEQRPLRERAGEQRGQLVDVDGLRQVLGRPGLQRVDRGRDVSVPRQNEDRQMAVAGAQPPRHLDAVEVGHDEVGDDRIGGRLGMMRQERVGAVEQSRLEPGPQVGGHELGMHEVVVEDVDFGTHGSNIGSGAPLIWRQPRTQPGPMAGTPPAALIIDDDRDLLLLVRRTLEFTAGWEVRTASTGASGIELAKTMRPQIILVDLMMPEMDGYEVCRRLKADAATAGIPVVFLTARRDLDERRLADAGAAGVVFKPFQPETLAQQVRELCR